MSLVTGRTLGLAVFGAAMWGAWLGWDHTYYKVDGVDQGPYRAWQVLGCGLAIAVAVVLTYLRTRRPETIWAYSVAGCVGFAVPWAIDASSDPTGLWAVGLFFLLAGGILGLVLLLSIIDAVATPDGSPSRALALSGGAATVALLVYPVATIVPLIAAVWILFRQALPAGRTSDLAHRRQGLRRAMGICLAALAVYAGLVAIESARIGLSPPDHCPGDPDCGMTPSTHLWVALGLAVAATVLGLVAGRLLRRPHPAAFNPPPGWPQPPPGWVPYPGWQPDPSWPAAPPDWKWSRDGRAG